MGIQETFFGSEESGNCEADDDVDDGESEPLIC